MIGLAPGPTTDQQEAPVGNRSGAGGRHRRRPPTDGPRALLVGSVIAIALIVLLLVVLGSHSPAGPSSGPVVNVGGQAPDFTLPSLTGGAPVRLDALGRERRLSVILNFFASWCTPCRQETPLLARTAAAEQARGAPLQFVGVDVADKPTDALPFVKASGINYPVGADPDFHVSATLYGLDGEPNTFFIDREGRVVGHVIGALTPAQLDRWVDRLTGSH